MKSHILGLDLGAFWGCESSSVAHLRLGEVDETALLLGEVLRGPLLVLPVALVLKHLNLIGAAEIIAATGRDVWHGSLAATAQRHHTALAHYMAPLSAAHVTRSTLAARHCWLSLRFVATHTWCSLACCSTSPTATSTLAGHRLTR